MKLIRLVLSAAVCMSIAGCDELLDLGGGGDGDLVDFSAGYAFVRDGDIFVADRADYAAAKRLTRGGSNSDPSLSADGRTIVFVHSDMSGETSIRRVSTGGGSESVVVPSSASRKLSQPAISAQGRIAFVSSPDSTTSTISLVNLDGSGEVELPQSYHDASPTFYPDGNSLLAITGSSTLTRQELVRIELSGVRHSRAANLRDLEKRAVISPDGRRVAFEARSGGEVRVFVINETGESSSLRAVANTGGSETSPTWISNTVVGFVSDAGGALSNLYEVDVTGSADEYQLVLGDARQVSFGGR